MVGRGGRSKGCDSCRQRHLKCGMSSLNSVLQCISTRQYTCSLSRTDCRMRHFAPSLAMHNDHESLPARFTAFHHSLHHHVPRRDELAGGAFALTDVFAQTRIHHDVNAVKRMDSNVNIPLPSSSMSSKSLLHLQTAARGDRRPLLP
jgi:hypothetical protein